MEVQIVCDSECKSDDELYKSEKDRPLVKIDMLTATTRAPPQRASLCDMGRDLTLLKKVLGLSILIDV